MNFSSMSDLEIEQLAYSKPIAGGKGGKQTTTQEVTPQEQGFQGALLDLQRLLNEYASPSSPHYVGKGIQDLLKISPEERSASELLSSRAEGEGARLGGLRGRLESIGAAPLNTESFVAPIRREFEQTVFPQIRSAAVRYGAPGGSVDQQLTQRAGGEYTGRVSEALGGLELQRRAQELGGVGQSAGLTPLQHSLASIRPSETGRLAGLERDLGIQRVQTPLTLALAAKGSQIPQFARNITTESQASPFENILGGAGGAYLLYKLLKGLGGFVVGGPPGAAVGAATP